MADIVLSSCHREHRRARRRSGQRERMDTDRGFVVAVACRLHQRMGLRLGIGAKLHFEPRALVAAAGTRLHPARAMMLRLRRDQAQKATECRTERHGRREEERKGEAAGDPDHGARGRAARHCRVLVPDRAIGNRHRRVVERANRASWRVA